MGNLAPGGAVGKITGKEGLYFKGPAKVYEGEEDALKGVLRGDVVKGDVVVIRQRRPRRRPRHARNAVTYQRHRRPGLIKDVAPHHRRPLLRRLARFRRRPHRPEAAKGGPIGIVQNGDLIEIDAVKNTMSLLIPDADYAARLAAYKPLPPKETRGVLAKYAKLVSTASEGAVTGIRVCSRRFQPSPILAAATENGQDRPCETEVSGCYDEKCPLQNPSWLF